MSEAPYLQQLFLSNYNLDGLDAIKVPGPLQTMASLFLQYLLFFAWSI